jgi:ribosomal-protein-alanine N-acetyltransferase
MALRLDHSVPLPAETHVRIGPLRRRHLRQVMKIEHQVYPRPWTPGIFTSELAQRDTRCYLAARVGLSIVGYCGTLYSADDAHITNIAVDPKWHRHKIGTRLLVASIRHSIGRGAKNLTLEVRVSNVGAQQMYRQFGMAPAGVRPNYYENVEDAIVMWAQDIDAPEYLARLEAIDAAVPGRTSFEGA